MTNIIHTRVQKAFFTLALSSLSASLLAMSKPATPDPVTETVVYPAADTIVRFIAIGDSGTGKDGQYKVAAAMKEICQQRGCDFAIGLGDNIYESGVDGVNDIQFDLKFEDPYKELDFPFYMTLGNHDNSWIFGGDGADNDKGEIQVDYHYRTDRKSNKWQMPARMYQFDAPLNAATPLISFFRWTPTHPHPPETPARNTTKTIIQRCRENG